MKHKMADIEERPSKIRKLDTSEEPPAKAEEAPKENEKPTNDQPANEPEDPNEEQNESEKGNQEQAQDTSNLSKSQQKKLRRKQEWEAGKEYRRVLRRQKHKEKQARKAEARAELEAKYKSGELEPPVSVPGKKGPSRPIQVPVTLILDCDFNELMLEKEIISLSAQLTRCYSDNKCSPYRSHLVMSSWGGSLKDRFETVLSSNHLSWKGVKFTEGNFVDAAKEMDSIMRGPKGGREVGALAPKKEEATAETKENGSLVAPETKAEAVDTIVKTEEPPLNSDISKPDPEQKTKTDSISAPSAPEKPSSKPEEPTLKAEPQIVYLSSDSPDTLTSLSPNTSYIIGGIVDKNRHKGLCYKRACELGIPTAKLPIGEYMTMQSRSVLAINHVVEIMLKWLETGDWGEAFLSVIPKRKEAKLKNSNQVKKEEESESESDAEMSGMNPEEEEEVEIK
jgi:tRNA (guanine9-N1)-methyltransferase